MAVPVPEPTITPEQLRQAALRAQSESAARKSYEEEMRRKREAEAKERHIEIELPKEYKKLLEKLAETARVGGFTYTYGTRDYDASTLFREWLAKSGFAVISKDVYVAEEHGDPDSGEGAHDSYTWYTLTITW